MKHITTTLVLLLAVASIGCRTAPQSAPQASLTAAPAIGDIVATQALAHVASHEGIVAVEHAAHLAPHPVDYDKIPSCTYCQPEVASIGLSEEEAVRRGHDVVVGKFPFSAIGKAKILDDTRGFVKIVTDKKYDEVLGVHIIGAHATELIAEATAALNLEATAESLFRAVHAHPTLAEAMAARLGWKCISTDSLARHPGRPWRTAAREVPRHVADHYASASAEELIEDVLRHYESVWPTIESLIRAHAADLSAERLIIEGSAIWPERVAAMRIDGVAAFWLTANLRLLSQRIRTASRFERASPRERVLVERFLGRAELYNERMMDAVNRLKLDSIDVSAAPTLDALMERALRLAPRPGC